MSKNANNLLHVIGTHEAVAEVAMFLCQDSHVKTQCIPGATLDRSAVVAKIGFSGELSALSLHRDQLLAITNGRPVLGYRAEAFGITPLPAQDGDPALFRLSMAFLSSQDARIFALALSERFPATTVGLRDIADNGSLYSIDGYAAGEEVLSIDGTRIPADPDSWEQREEGADEEQYRALQLELEQERDAFGLDQLIDVAHERRRLVAAPPSTTESVTFGWPRWSLLAHAAYSDDVSGIHDALAGIETHAEKLAVLQEECRNAAARGVASWMDTALFGDPVNPSQDAVDAATPAASYRQLRLEHYAPRQLRLLSFLALSGDGAPESLDQRALADALLSSLADPDARLSSGLHPGTFLTAACAHAQAHALPHAPEALEGLEKLLVELASRVPRAAGAAKLTDAGSSTAPENGLDMMLCSVIAIALQPHMVKSQMKPALGAGAPGDVLVRSLVLADQAASGNRSGVDAARILRVLTDSYGAASRIPTLVTEEFALLAPQLARSYEAMCTAEAMQAQITAAPNRSETPRRSARL